MSQSLYARYLKERENFNIIETEQGFVTYFISGEECYARDIFILPGYRKMNLASDLLKEVEAIAKEQGCKYLAGTVFPKANGSTESLLAAIKYGFKVVSSTNEKIILIKEL